MKLFEFQIFESDATLILLIGHLGFRLALAGLFQFIPCFSIPELSLDNSSLAFQFQRAKLQQGYALSQRDHFGRFFRASLRVGLPFGHRRVSIYLTPESSAVYFVFTSSTGSVEKASDCCVQGTILDRP